jgi:hypothetical protein
VEDVSALPAAVRKQIERSKQIQQDYYEKGIVPGQPAPEPTAEEIAAAKVVTDKEAADKVAADAAAAAAATAKPGEQPPTAQLPAAQVDWQQKYLVLQGKYNSEVPRLQGQLREQGQQIGTLREETQAMTNLLASLNQQQRPAAVPPAAAPAAGKLVKDEEIKEYGPDLIDVMRRIYREESTGVLAEVDKRVAPLSQQVQSVQQSAGQVAQKQVQTDRERVMTMLAQQVPTWQTQNEDPKFLEWLDQVDPYSGQQRGVLLKSAFQSFDGPRVVAFFLGFQNENAVIDPPVPPIAPLANGAPQKTLESLIAPGTPKAGTGSAPDGSGKRVFTRAEIGKFYADKAAGKYATRKADGDKLEREIFTAQKEGRISA